MAKLLKAYMIFYVNGRGEEVLDDRGTIDEEALADRVMEGEPIHEVLTKVSDDVGAKLLHDREKKDWIAENREDIDEAGGDSEEAYRHYVQGRKDQYAHELEVDVVEKLFEDEDDDEDDDGDGDGDGSAGV